MDANADVWCIECVRSVCLQGGQGDAEYLYAFHRIVVPVVSRFQPELILISAGFDAALGDPVSCDALQTLDALFVHA